MPDIEKQDEQPEEELIFVGEEISMRCTDFRDYIRRVRKQATEKERERLKDEALKQYGLGQQEGVKYGRQSLRAEIEGLQKMEGYNRMSGKIRDEDAAGYSKALSDILQIISKE